MAARYEHYGTATVGDFVQDTFGRFGRQLVLVDVLGALSAGREPSKTPAEPSLKCVGVFVPMQTACGTE